MVVLDMLEAYQPHAYPCLGLLLCMLLMVLMLSLGLRLRLELCLCSSSSCHGPLSLPVKPSMRTRLQADTPTVR